MNVDKIAMGENTHSTDFPLFEQQRIIFWIRNTFTKIQATTLSNRQSNYLFLMGERNALAWTGQDTLAGGEKQKEIFLYHSYYNITCSEIFFSLYPEQPKK